MSYFAIISGESAASIEAVTGRLVPISEAQSYIANLAPNIAAVDGSPSLFWDDNETGTSHKVVSAVEECIFEKRPVEASALGQLIKSCESCEVTVRVWWASNEPDAFNQVAETTNAAEALALLQMQASKGAGIGFAMHPNNSLKRTAASRHGVD